MTHWGFPGPRRPNETRLYTYFKWRGGGVRAKDDLHFHTIDRSGDSPEGDFAIFRFSTCLGSLGTTLVTVDGTLEDGRARETRPGEDVRM